MSGGHNNKAKASAYRHSDAGRMARQMYLARPEVRRMRAIKRAIKSHRPPPTGPV